MVPTMILLDTQLLPNQAGGHIKWNQSFLTEELTVLITTISNSLHMGDYFCLVCRNGWSHVSLSKSDLLFVFVGGCRPRGHRLHFGVHYNHCTRRQTLFSLCSFLTLPWNIFFLFMASACLFSVGHRSRRYEKLSHLHFYWFSTYSFRFLATKYFRYKITECERPGSPFI